MKSKGGKERYSHLNAEFQRTVRRDKKAFLTDQCKEIEESNRMGKTNDLLTYSKQFYIYTCVCVIIINRDISIKK